MGKQDVHAMSTADLYAMLLFVVADGNKIFGDNSIGKAMVRERQKELEEEMYNRIYGSNPFIISPKITKTEVKKDKGISVVVID